MATLKSSFSIRYLFAFSYAGPIGESFVKKAVLAGGLSLGRKCPRSPLQQFLAALQHMMYQLVHSRLIIARAVYYQRRFTE
jgi:hypothetical protein